MWYPGHIQKAKNSIKKNLKLVNAIIEIIDARAPYSTRAYEYQSLFADKKKIILFNKHDICDDKKTQKWVEIYKSKGYEVIKISMKKVNVKQFIEKNVSPLIPEKFFEKRAMIIGVPNTGKSTFINSLKGKKSALTGNTPGITRGVQWINVDKKLKVMDTPGILFPELYNKNIIYKLILIGSLKAEGQEADEALNFAFNYLKINYPQLLNKIVENSSELLSSFEFINAYSQKRNYLKKGGETDFERGKQSFLKNLAEGKYGKITFETEEDFEEIIL